MDGGGLVSAVESDVVSIGRGDRYYQFFHKILSEHYRKDLHGGPETFLDFYLQQWTESLSEKGHAKSVIDRELALARRGAELASQSFQNLDEAGLSAVRNIDTGESDVPGGAARPGRLRIWVLGAIMLAIVTVYFATNVLFFRENATRAAIAVDRPDQTAMTLDVEIANFGEKELSLLIVPVAGRFVGKDRVLTDDITIAVEGGDGPEVHTFRKGTLVPPFAAKVEIDTGDILNYPFDVYTAEIDVMTHVAGNPVPTKLILDQIPHGLSIVMAERQPSQEDVGEILLIKRSWVAMLEIFLSVFSLVLVCASSLWVAIVVVIQNREVSFEILVWTAALLFVIPTIRGTLPGSPPFGASIDFLVFFWLDALVAAATLALVVTWHNQGT